MHERYHHVTFKVANGRSESWSHKFAVRATNSTKLKLPCHLRLLPQPPSHLTPNHPMPIPFRPRLPPPSLTRFAKAFIWVPALVIFLNDHVAHSAFVTGVSMKPTLSPHYSDSGASDLVLFNVWSARKDLKRGDVAQFMSPNKPEQFAVKRIIAVPGDTVILDPRRRPAVGEGPEPTAARAWDSWQGRAVVPPGHVWVEGDNWRKTSDSNWYGPISKSLITGKAVAVLWPGERFWTRPWEGWRGRTRVVEAAGDGLGEGHWTERGLPVELAEVGDVGLPKG